MFVSNVADGGAVGHSVCLKQLAMHSVELDLVLFGIEGSNAICERLLKEVPRVRRHEAVLEEKVLRLLSVNHELESGCGRKP